MVVSKTCCIFAAEFKNNPKTNTIMSEIKAKTQQLIDECAQHMKNNLDRVLSSGVVKIENYSEDSYLLPKMILVSLLRQGMYEYEPMVMNTEMAKEIDEMYWSL